MRTVSFLKFYVVAVSVLYILYSLVSLTGMQRVILTLAFTAVSPGAFREVLKIRGVRRGDAVLVSRSMSFFMQKVPGRALENGRRGMP